jgi:hypothetical protein
MSNAGPQRPLTTKILSAFDLAVQQRDREVALQLYRALELLLSKPPAPDDQEHREAIQAAMAAFDRLRELRSL